jgi:hypothetical protein
MTSVTRFKDLAKLLVREMLTMYFVKKSSQSDLQTLGSPYGSWTIDVSQDLAGMDLISGGLGEDASFDLEFISKFSSRVILVDPTNRAEEHFSRILNQLGHSATSRYSQDGSQPVAAYDLSKVSETQLVFIKKALWESKCQLKLFPPKNPSHVSFSLKEGRRTFKRRQDFLLVDAIPVYLLMKDFNVGDNCILKLDIEGAEIATIQSLLSNGVRPQQILVEYEFLTLRNLHRVWEVFAMHKRLCLLGYEMVHLHLGKNATYRKIYRFVK